jgi:hypothetical protein
MRQHDLKPSRTASSCTKLINRTAPSPERPLGNTLHEGKQGKAPFQSHDDADVGRTIP